MLCLFTDRNMLKGEFRIKITMFAQLSLVM